LIGGFGLFFVGLIFTIIALFRRSSWKTTVAGWARRLPTASVNRAGQHSHRLRRAGIRRVADRRPHPGKAVRSPGRRRRLQAARCHLWAARRRLPPVGSRRRSCAPARRPPPPPRARRPVVRVAPPPPSRLDLGGPEALFGPTALVLRWFPFE
jgi:hypothetical protein